MAPVPIRSLAPSGNFWEIHVAMRCNSTQDRVRPVHPDEGREAASRLALQNFLQYFAGPAK